MIQLTLSGVLCLVGAGFFFAIAFFLMLLTRAVASKKGTPGFFVIGVAFFFIMATLFLGMAFA